MPKTYKTAAKSTHNMADDRRKQLLTVGLVTLGTVIVIGIVLVNSSSLKIGGITFLVLLIAIRLITDWFDSYSRKKAKTIRRADRGADAEEKIADILDQLSDEFVVLHDIDSPFGNIDHIVISQKGGVFLLETKSHHGTVTTTDGEILVNGTEPEKDFVGQTLKNSYWLRDEFQSLINVKPWITPLLVFTNAFVKYGRPVKGVQVINAKFLLRTLQIGQPNSMVNATIWSNRERLANHLAGQEEVSTPEPVKESTARFCPKCGRPLVEKTAKSGSQVGKRFLVCPGYPECRTAILID